MRPLRLKMEGFGPFRESESVDFRVLRYSKLFLIQGPVGSGKTFLLDGLCFALFGRSSGGERQRKELRNISVEPGRDTVVVLDFEVSGDSYRVERRIVVDPDSEEFRPDEVTLWRLPEIGEPNRRDILSASTAGVESTMTRLLGLSADQYCQIAILPQGKFRKFLLADEAERRDILSRIFGVEKFERFQNKLTKLHSENAAKLKASWSAREELIAQYGDKGGDPREFLNRSQEDLETVDQSCKQHQEKSQEWERSLEDAIRFETLDRQREMSLRELAALENEEVGTENQLSNRLRKAIGPFERWRSLSDEVAQISSDLDRQRAEYEKLKRDTNYLEEEVEKARRCEEERYTLQRSLEKLEELAHEAEGLRALEEQVLLAEERLSGLSEKRSQLAVEVKRGKVQHHRLSRELEKIKLAEQKIGALREEVKHLELQQHGLRQRAHLEDAVSQAKRRLEKLDQLTTELESQSAENLASMGSQATMGVDGALQLLSVHLLPRKACPLCGSRKHPKPFEGDEAEQTEVVDYEARQAEIDRKLEIASSERTQARDRLLRLEGRLEGTAAVLDSDEGVDGILQRLKKTLNLVESKVQQKQELREQLTDSESSLLPARRRLKKMRLLRERLEATLEGATSTRDQKRLRLKSLLKDLVDVSGDNPSSWVQALSREREALESRKQELEEVEYSTDRAELMAETFALQLAETRATEINRAKLQAEADDIQESLLDQFRLEFGNWTDLSFAINRVLRESKVQSGEDFVLDKETLVRTVRRQLNQSEELLATIPDPQMKSEQIRAALSREREQIELKVGRKASLQRSVSQGLEDVGRYDDLVEAIRDVEKEISILAPLSELASGNNERGLTFADWMLQRCFRRVVEAANVRLEVLAPNQFLLELGQGIELKVMEVRTRLLRSANTLSGGESFLASLALALGLGDTLQADSSTKEELETLFIDEGFGFLDRRSLDAALDCLEALKVEGRSVGIVSHLPALRERIRAQIVLASGSRAARGSRIQVFTN